MALDPAGDGWHDGFMTAPKYLVFAIASLACGMPCLAQEPSASASDHTARPTLQAALGLPEGVRISGSIRPRYETLTNQFVAGRTGDDEILNLRSSLKLEVDAGPLTLVGEFVDSRLIAGNDGGGAAGEIDTLEPIQLHALWKAKGVFAPGAELDIMAGRFAMDVGSRRLTARANFRSFVQSFDGVHATWTGSDHLKITAFAVHPATRAPSDIDSALNNEAVFNPTIDSITFTGAHLDTPLPDGMRGEAYVFGLNESDTSDTPSRNRDLLTVGARLRKTSATSAFDFDLEYAHQTGTERQTTSPLDVTGLDHEASMLHLEGGYTFDMAMSPRLSLHYDFASGDASPTDSKSGRFDSLYGDRSFELGPTSIWGALSRNNLSSAGIRLEAELDEASDAYIMLRQIDLAEARDRFGNSGVVDITGASGTDVGQQVEVRYRRWLQKDVLRLSLGGAALFNEGFLETAPNATGQGDAFYGYTELTWTF
ncbi:MAG: hypothetical protein B7Y90_09950 [Alphaproteobacteria bacterium 32-64-14]|nr:MAG: hypothetical protein B7Y90_09950 [Alphaproteobacteria bacterium 32-64-14]